ncbi:MAG: class II aldolase/adducin family protein [Limnohabitans sp.]|nr:class II aldolase/adducin family protein [Limnohabitans sp.]
MIASANTQLINDLVVANHILVNEGVVDSFGHISVRHDKHPDRFLISKSMAPALVIAKDVLCCDLDGQVLESQERCYVERFIHSEIYKARPDVMSVIHSHSPAIIPFVVTKQRLRPICHMSGFLGAKTPVFEIRLGAGESIDLLIRNQALGKALADSLGPHAVALMRGHGSVTVGYSIQQAVYRAIYTESNARLQIMSMPLGDIEYLTDEEAKATAEMNDQHLGRPWQMWKRKVQHGSN